jgi:hypothetical protein
VPEPLVAVCVTVYVPAVAKVIVGFWDVAVVIVTPVLGLAVQFQLVGVLVDASVNVVGCPAHLVAEVVKFAVGIELAV